jgi:hypothetical protein
VRRKLYPDLPFGVAELLGFTVLLFLPALVLGGDLVGRARQRQRCILPALLHGVPAHQRTHRRLEPVPGEDRADDGFGRPGLLQRARVKEDPRTGVRHEHPRPELRADGLLELVLLEEPAEMNHV